MIIEAPCGKCRQFHVLEIASAETQVPFIECFLGDRRRVISLHDGKREFLLSFQRMRRSRRRLSKKQRIITRHQII